MRVGIQEDDQLDDATRAFEDLRAEVAVLRRAVEALGPALKENRSPDYTPATFGEQVERAVTNASREAGREAEDLVQGIFGVCHEAQAMLGSARTREAQNWSLAQAAVLGVVAG